MLIYESHVLKDVEPITIYAGKDKFENEDLIRYALTNDVWFHVDKLSSPHIYLRIPDGVSWTWENIPQPLIDDCAQLVKAGSIQGNKVNNLAIIYTPAKNLKKTGDMEVGQVSFYKDKLVKRTRVETRENAIVNRLNKTKKEVTVDFEAEAIARQKQDSAAKKAAAEALRKARKEEEARRKKEKEESSYDRLFTEEAMEEARRNQADEDDDDFFM